MLDFTMTIEVPSGITTLSNDLGPPIENLHELAGQHLVDLYKFYVFELAFDTGNLSRSIHLEPGSGMSDRHTSYVVASAPYAAVVEYGWIDRGQGQVSYPGKFPAKQAIDTFMEQLDSGIMGNQLAQKEWIKKGHEGIYGQTHQIK